jgi:hypothetical protein
MATSIPCSLRWGFVFLQCPVRLQDEEREELLRLAVQAYMDDAAKVDFDLPFFSGSVRCVSDTVALGSFIGQRFSAEVHVPHGSGNVEFLVAEARLRSPQGVVAEA